MLTRAKVFSVTMAALLVLTLVPGAPTIAAPSSPGRMDPFLPVEEEWPQRPHMAAAPAAEASTSADAQNVEFVGHIGGATLAVAVQGDYAYIGEGPRLAILDISNPASPTVAGKTVPLPGVVRGVAVTGGYAYIADREGGLRVVDVSTPANPAEVGFYDTPGHAYGVAVAGGYAYIADWGGGLRVVDISNPVNPTEVGFYQTPVAKSVAVAGNYAYVADGYPGGLRVIDISTPNSPTEVGFCNTPDHAHAVTVSGSYAYVIVQGGGLRVIDISTPNNPTEVGFFNDTSWSAQDVAVVEDYAYMAASSGGLRVVDVSTPSSPTEVGFCNVPKWALAVAVSGGYAYIAVVGGGLQLVDTSTPTNPTTVGFYGTPRSAVGVDIAGRYAYIVGGRSGLLRVVDVSTPSSPTEVGFYDTPGHAKGVDVAGSYAYIIDGHSGLRVVDISNPSDPTEVGSYKPPGNAWCVAVAISGNYAYIAVEGSGLQIVDISNPSNPTMVGSYNTQGLAREVTVSGNYAYLIDLQYGLRVIDVSTPANPTEVGFYNPTPGFALDVAVSGNYAYVLSGGLRVVDISIPSSPTEVGFYQAQYGGWDVAVSGNYAYVIAGIDLRVIDISTPSNPTRVGFYDTPDILSGDVLDIAVSGNYIYVANGEAGLFILCYTGPTYTISGHLRDGSGNPISGVTVSAGASGSATTDASGAYTLTGAIAGTYTLTPIKNGYTFSPASRTVSVPPDASGQDFTATPIPGQGLSISHMEVTQAIQDEANSVPLIAGKPTFVRVYVDCGEGCSSLANVTGILRGYGPGGEFDDSPRSPVNFSVTAYHENWTAQRGNLEKTLNFTLPSEWANGVITLTVEVAGVQHSETVTFQEARAITVVYVPIRYNGQSPDLSRIQNGSWWADRVYPTAEINYVPSGGTLDWNRDLEEDSNVNSLLNELTTRHFLVNAYIFGWLPEGTFGGGISDPAWYGGAGKAAFADDHPTEGQRIFTHEIAHLMGRRHTNTGECGDVDPDTDWPYATARIQDYGLDGYGFGWLLSSPSAVKNPDNTYDYMSYCGSLISDTVWTSPWTYERIYLETLKPQVTAMAAQRLSTLQPYFITSGLVYTDDTATLDPIWVISTTITPANPPEGTQYCLEAQDVSATSLISRCFDLTFVNYETGEDTNVDGFNLMLPYPSGVSRVVLKKGTTELAVQLVSTSTPTVTVASPNGGETWAASGTYTITWTASDADGDSLTYRVLYSSDGSGWVPVGAAITETHLTVNAAELAGGDGARVRVLVSDGVNTSADESDANFTVERKEPQTVILSPEGDGDITFGTPLWLQGYAYDLEDGPLGESALRWASNRDGDLGTGSQVLVTLSSGQHAITLTATDSSSNMVTASVVVTMNVPPAGVTIGGPTAGDVQASYTFTATVNPLTANRPITYVWQATGQSPVTSTGGLTDTVAFTWSVCGPQPITVTATNDWGAITGAHVITVQYSVYLPLVLRNF